MKEYKSILYFALIPILLIALIVIYYIGRGAGTNAAKASTDNAIKNQFEHDIVKDDLSYSLTTFDEMAQACFNAMVGWSYNYTDIKTVFEKLNTQSDLYQLIKSFGDAPSKINVLGLYSWDFYKSNLTGWLTDQLSDSEKQELMNLLSAKNITYII